MRNISVTFMRNIVCTYYEFNSNRSRQMIFLFLALLEILFVGAEHLINFGRGLYQEQLCEIILSWPQQVN